MSGWFTFFLVLHILAAIAVFGPTFAFPVIGGHSAKNPAAAPTVAHIMESIEKRIVIPGAVVMPFLGLALIFTGHFQLWRSTWLVIGIGLYIVAFTFAVTVQLRNMERLTEALDAMPARPPAAEGLAPVAGGSGPPAHIAALVRRTQMGGMFLTVMIVTITILMIWRPGNCQFAC